MSKRFEDWKDVDCNECEHYWTNSCDGACKGSQKPCNSFLATRSVIIPEQITRLDKRITALGWGVLFIAFGLFVHYCTCGVFG